jgi:hypothetical protein
MMLVETCASPTLRMRLPLFLASLRVADNVGDDIRIQKTAHQRSTRCSSNTMREMLTASLATINGTARQLIDAVRAAASQE